MPTADNCRARADEADRLASIVSYGRDKERLKEQAEFWRARAATLDAVVEEPAPRSPLAWLRRRCS